MAKTLENALNNAVRKGHIETRSRESIDWFRANLRKTTNSISPERLMREEQSNLVNSWTNVGPGRLYFVQYEA